VDAKAKVSFIQVAMLNLFRKIGGNFCMHAFPAKNKGKAQT